MAFIGRRERPGRAQALTAVVAGLGLRPPAVSGALYQSAGANAFFVMRFVRGGPSARWRRSGSGTARPSAGRVTADAPRG